MHYKPLGRTGMKVSALCLGSMTWGVQNTQADGHRQMDYAADAGINFIDTAELYPTNPTSAETQGRTEEIIGTWFKASGKRADVILATKVTGRGHAWIRDAAPISGASVTAAIEGSLRRLQTDYVDLYQLHWPNREHYHFRNSWKYDPGGTDTARTKDHMLEVLRSLDELVKAGKIRAFGLSNETCWGTAQWLDIAEENGLPRVASIQNEYSLLQRLFDLDLAELAHHEDVGLMAFSPLAAGLLTGKYRGGKIPPGSRRSRNEKLGGRYTEKAVQAVDSYAEIAERHGLDMAQMALAFCLARPFMTATIIGATNMDQLATNIGAVEVKLSDEVMEEIAAVHREFPIPM
ncbi:MAG TPA: aldo/keto reductase [Afifellaceae bacterium]|nr:aldo/keto reductase [Afifellaceae bacterium]